MSSRSNARKSALQILFSYEFELTSIVKDHLEVLCPYIIKMGFAGQLVEDINLPSNVDQPSLENDTQIQNTFKMIETRILEDLQYHYLIQAHTTISNREDTIPSLNGRQLDQWLQSNPFSYEDVISFIQKQVQTHISSWFSDMSLYFWNTRLQNLIEPIDTSRLSKEQNLVYTLLCKQDVLEDNALHIAQNQTLYQDYEILSQYCQAPRLLAYWICTNQHSLLEEVRKYPKGLEQLGTYLQKVAEGQLQLNQLKQYLNKLIKYLERERDISKIDITGNYTTRNEMSPILELEDDVDWGSTIPTIDEIQYAEKLVVGSLNNWINIDQIIHNASSTWSMNRMTQIDRSILRIGVFEMIYCSKDVPTRVVIDEALRLSHSFAEQGHSSPDKRDTNKSSRFINGILDRIAKENKLLQ